MSSGSGPTYNSRAIRQKILNLCIRRTKARAFLKGRYLGVVSDPPSTEPIAHARPTRFRVNPVGICRNVSGLFV